MMPSPRTVFVCLLMLGVVVKTQAVETTLHWLDTTAPTNDAGVSFGIPWPKGTVHTSDAFSIVDQSGHQLPLQHWPLAYWPDGSIKWSGYATLAATEGSFVIKSGTVSSDLTSPKLTVHTTESGVVVDTGILSCRIPLLGDTFIDWIKVAGKQVARSGRLVCILQEGQDEATSEAPSRENQVGRIEKVTVEQEGPVRAVVRIEGKQYGAKTGRLWLPFTVRLYFYAGQETVKLIHSFIFDGNQDKDFIKGLGIEFAVPYTEEVQNRAVRFSGEADGLWSEPVQPLVGRQGRAVVDPSFKRDPKEQSATNLAYQERRSGDVYPTQITGKRVPNRSEVSKRDQALMDDWAVWDDFRLEQSNADGFTIIKRTNPNSAWIQAGAGKRSSGYVFTGDVSGGLAVSLKNFWQSYPATLEVQHASQSEAKLCVWLWSPYGSAMDLRHYDIKSHGLDAVYEDVQPGFSTATGIARTSELTLYATASIPTKLESALMAKAGQKPPLLIATPQTLHAAGVFGIWSLPDRSTPLKKMAEEQLDAGITLYEKEVEQRHWYGFWYFGNVMHSYDSVRHVWRYDLGGMAWDNTELASDMWLWYSFLRTGRADIFRLAEAETRNTSEVDVYHLGRFTGLGSRHNVVPWGCGAKEARISQAAWKRYYYYLTTDERVGDLMHEVANVDYKALEIDSMRLAQPPTENELKFPSRVRAGPDWLAFIGNWMTEWERTGDTKWRDKIYVGMDCLSAMPLGIRSGRNLVFGYDPQTGKLSKVSDELGDYNLMTIQGGAEVVFELNTLVDNAKWQKTWLQYCRLEGAPEEVIVKDMQTSVEGDKAQYVGRGQGGARLAAYAYLKTGNKAYADKAIALAFGGFGGLRAHLFSTVHVEGSDVLNPIDEAPSVGTNGAAQTSLTAIEVLSMCADKLPENPPKPTMRGNERSRERVPGGVYGDRRTPGS